MKNKYLKYTFITVFVLFALITIASSIVITYKNEYKLIWQFGKVDRVISNPGISLKIPFIQSARALPQNLLLYEMSASEVITKDKKTMVTDTYTLWRITEPLLYAQSLGSSMENAQTRIDANVYNSLKTVIGRMDQTDVIQARDSDFDEKSSNVDSEARVSLNKAIVENIGNAMDGYGIELISVETKRLDLPSDNKVAVYDRMISEREKIAMTFTAEGDSESQIIKNTTDREISILLSESEAEGEKTIAEGEAEYMKILSQAYSSDEKSEFYSFVRSLDAAKLSLVGNNKTLILPKESPIAQIFMGQ